MTVTGRVAKTIPLKIWTICTSQANGLQTVFIILLLHSHYLVQ